MHRLESNILHHAKKKREQRKFAELDDRKHTRYLYKEVETDDRGINYFNNIENHLKEHNEYFLTNYKTLEEFNNKEPYRVIIKIN